MNRIALFLCSTLLLACTAYAAEATVEVYSDVHDGPHPARPPPRKRGDDDDLKKQKPPGGIKQTLATDLLNDNSKINVNVDYGPPTSPSSGRRKFASVLGPIAFAPPSTIVRGDKPVKRPAVFETPTPRLEDVVMVTPTPLAARKSKNTHKKRNYDITQNDAPVNVNVDFDAAASPTVQDRGFDGRKIDTVLGPDAYAPPKSEKSSDDDCEQGGVHARRIDAALGAAAYTPPKSAVQHGGAADSRKLDTALGASMYAPPKSTKHSGHGLKNKDNKLKLRPKVGIGKQEPEQRPVSALDLPNGETNVRAVRPPTRYDVSKKDKDMTVVVIDYS